MIASGSSASVYRCVEKSAERQLACKLSRREESRWPWNHVLDLYEREAKLLRHVQGHPNVIQFAGLYKEPSRIYMVMELVKGGDLHTILTKQRCLPEEAARAAFTQLVSAIDHLHANGVLHRDIKLENVLFDQTAHPPVIKVCDLGNSMLMDQPPAGNFKGTNGYTAPEVSSGSVANWTPKADVWALGVVLYAMLGGYLPFDDARGRHSSSQYLDFSNAAWWEISVEAKLLIQSMLTPSLADRATLDDVIDSPWLARVDPSRLPTPVAAPMLHPVASMPIIADVITRCAPRRARAAPDGPRRSSSRPARARPAPAQTVAAVLPQAERQQPRGGRPQGHQRDHDRRGRGDVRRARRERAPAGHGRGRGRARRGLPNVPIRRLGLVQQPPDDGVGRRLRGPAGRVRHGQPRLPAGGADADDGAARVRAGGRVRVCGRGRGAGRRRRGAGRADALRPHLALQASGRAHVHVRRAEHGGQAHAAKLIGCVRTYACSYLGSSVSS